MEEKELKTSGKQRFFIILIAVLMLGSVIAGYVAIVASGSSRGETTELKVDEEKIAEYTEEYEKAMADFSAETTSEFAKLSKYWPEKKAYNENTANSEGVKTRDLEIGTGAEIVDDKSEYLAYYFGWCADETVFDSSFDSNENPTALIKVLDPSVGMIKGWDMGVKGMKLGGVRELTIPSEYAYGDTRELCGGTNKPLKFIVMAVEKVDNIVNLSEAIHAAGRKLQNAYYGINE